MEAVRPNMVEFDKICNNKKTKIKYSLDKMSVIMAYASNAYLCMYVCISLYNGKDSSCPQVIFFFLLFSFPKVI